jgi:hypothetical protein
MEVRYDSDAGSQRKTAQGCISRLSGYALRSLRLPGGVAPGIDHLAVLRLKITQALEFREAKIRASKVR